MQILKQEFYTGKNETHGGFIALDLPSDAQILRLAEQSSHYGSGLHLWYTTEQNPETMTTQNKYFAPVFTGQEFTPIEWNYLESFETKEGLVVHIFQVPAEKISDVDKAIKDDAPTTQPQGEIHEQPTEPSPETGEAS